MAQPYHNKLLKRTVRDIQKTAAFDLRIKNKPPEDANQLKWLISHLYMNYVQIVNKLDECYDQIVHPQKREVIGRLLDTSLGRLLEIKRDIVKVELDDYVFFDNVLMELKMTHEDVEVRVPKHFSREREKAKEHRRKLIQEVFDEVKMEEFKEKYLKDVPEEEKEERWEKYLEAKEAERVEKEKQEEYQRRKLELAGAVEEVKVEEVVDDDDWMAIGDAIRIIQRHERARQDREKVWMAKRNKKIKETGVKPEKIPEEIAEEKAKIIQRHFRRYRNRVRTAKKAEKELLMLGMLEPSYKPQTVSKQIEDHLKSKRKIQDKNQEEYEKGIEIVTEKLNKMYKDVMKEDIKDEIRNWMRWFFEETKYFPDYPPPDPIMPTGEILGIPQELSPEFIKKNFPNQQVSQVKTGLAAALMGFKPLQGSALATAGHWIQPKEFLLCQVEIEKQKKAGKKAEKPKEEKKGKKKKEEEGDNFLEPLMKAAKDYDQIWSDMDESKNYEQRYLKELVKDDGCYTLSMHLRKSIDEMMKLELELLKTALAKDKKEKIAPTKPPKPPKPPKPAKDPTANQSDDELFKELYKNGVIKEYAPAYLKDYIGEHSYTAYEYRKLDEDPKPCTGDVRDLILQLCILPLGSSRVHQLSSLTRSVCLLGSPNNGKEFLARIVCTETASVMFDISPANLEGKYKGKKGLKVLQALIERMSKVLQPTVIFIDGAEKLFYKKVPPNEKKTDPKRLAKFLPKFIKTIKPEDQILILGVCSNPNLAKPAKLLKTFDKFIFVPQPEYGTYYHLWQRLLLPYHSLPREFDFSPLARVSKGYSVKNVMDAVSNVLTPERICRNRIKPYKAEDFINELLKMETAPPEMQEQCYQFLLKTPMAKKRAKKLEQIRVEKAKAAKKK